MIRARRLFVLSLLAALTAALPAAAMDDSLRCGGRSVSIGDARIDLLGRCGQPGLRERRVNRGEKTHAHGSDERAVPVRTGDVVVDEWTYDFGPNAFSYLVTLENGRITRIERLGRGVRDGPPPDPTPPPRARCDHLSGMHEGDAKLEVLSRCGEPAVTDRWEEAGGAVHVEVWTYDFGRSQFVRFVRFENGRVKSVTTGTWGYAD